MIDYQTLKNWKFADIECAYSKDDSMRYALALGVGRDPLDESQLCFVSDVFPGAPLALPTMAVILGYPGSWMSDADTGIEFAGIVHGEETLVMHRPLHSEGTLIARHRVLQVVDKGAGRGAVITYEKQLIDKSDGQLVASVIHTTFARKDGGFSCACGKTDNSPPPPVAVPRRAPDHIVSIPTLPQQALLYRLLADRNPLHAHPAIAQAAGFARPILHGLCTYGMAGLAVLKHGCDNQPQRLKSLSARFTAPVYPGETLRVELYREPESIQFRALVEERNVMAVDFGSAKVA